MTDVIVVPQAAHWQRLKRLVLDSVSSPITRRVYNLGLDEFFEWYGREHRPGFTKATVSAWRVALEARGLGAVSINVRITAVRKLAVEAADNLLDSDPRRVSDCIPCYALYTDPPLGRIGMTDAEVRKTGRPALFGRRPMPRVARAVKRENRRAS